MDTNQSDDETNNLDKSGLNEKLEDRQNFAKEMEELENLLPKDDMELFDDVISGHSESNRSIFYFLV